MKQYGDSRRILLIDQDEDQDLFSRTHGTMIPEDNLGKMDQEEMGIVINHNQIQELHNLYKLFLNALDDHVECVIR